MITWISFLTFLGISVCAFWLFRHRENYQRWYYLAYSLVFCGLALTVFIPQYFLYLGVLLLMVSAGQVLTNALIEFHLKSRMDLCNRRLIVP